MSCEAVLFTTSLLETSRRTGNDWPQFPYCHCSTWVPWCNARSQQRLSVEELVWACLPCRQQQYLQCLRSRARGVRGVVDGRIIFASSGNSKWRASMWLPRVTAPYAMWEALRSHGLCLLCSEMPVLGRSSAQIEGISRSRRLDSGCRFSLYSKDIRNSKAKKAAPPSIYLYSHIVFLGCSKEHGIAWSLA